MEIMNTIGRKYRGELMKKRVLAFILSLCLCAGMISSAGITVRAEEAAGVETEGESQEPVWQGDGQDTENQDTQPGTEDGNTEGETGTDNYEGGSGTGEEANGYDNPDSTAGTEEPDRLEDEAEPGTDTEHADSADEDAEIQEPEKVDPVEIQCMDEDGNIYYITDDVSPVVESNSAMFRSVQDQVVNLRVKKNNTVVTDITLYNEYGTGTQGYLYGQSGADAAYLGMENGRVKFMISGVIGLVDASQVQIVNKNSVRSVSCYYADGTYLYHRISTNLNTDTTSSLRVGLQQSYMSSGATYYSYDGNYFYTDYSVMLSDYRKNTRANSINAGNPYYNYYQYLSLRSKTAYSASQLSSKINSRIDSSSKMWNIGNSMVNHQNTYGVNALIMAGLAANESAWGRSSIAQSKNNLFGLNAVDSSPGASANTYSSPDACVRNFAEGWMSKRYLNPNNGNYFGGFLGNKASGLNVKYASDPYWGEKAASIAWSLDSDGADRNKYTIGVKDTISTGHTDLNVRKESSASSTKLFSTGSQSNHAFLILGEENGFYKVQSDPVLNSGRTGINGSSGNYNFSSMYAYVSKDYVDVVSGNVEPETSYSVMYSSHIQFIGWQDYAKNGGLSGTEGESKRLEAIKIKLNNAPYTGSVQYRVNEQDYGWLDWVKDDAVAGITGQSKRQEAIQIKLTGEMEKHFDIYYRVHAQNIGWMGWAKNGEKSGTQDYGLRLEAIQIRLVEKGGAAPGSTDNAFMQQTTSKKESIKYRTHVQFLGWQGYAYNGALSGTTGQSLRLEGIQISLDDKTVSGSIRYKTHVQFLGWQNWVKEGAVSGTTGQHLRLEAIQIELTGDMAKKYDIYYRVHSQFSGWLGWAKNGQKAGTAGYSRRLEGIQIQLVDKGGKAPGSTSGHFLEQ